MDEHYAKIKEQENMDSFQGAIKSDETLDQVMQLLKNNSKPT